MRSIAQFFASVADRPSALLLQGEAGIGKTTLWLAALQHARAEGFHVLSARAWEAESVLAYGTVADLVAGIDPAALTGLPDVQRIAVDRVLLRGAGSGPETDQHVVAAALLSVIEGLAVDAPVTVGIDDLQWLGLQWDEGPFRQSERTPLYNDVARSLITRQAAYRCYESAYADGDRTVRARAALPLARALERRFELERAVTMLETLLGLGAGTPSWREQAEARLRRLVRKRWRELARA